MQRCPLVINAQLGTMGSCGRNIYALDGNTDHAADALAASLRRQAVAIGQATKGAVEAGCRANKF